MKKLLAMILAVLMLAGCQLADEEQQNPTGTDELIGVVITTEHLSLFDMESYINDHIGEIMEEDEHRVSGDTSKYEGRIYAERVDGNWIFPGIDGMFFAYYQQDDNTWCATPDCGVSEGHCNLHTDESGTTMELTGTIYIDESAGEFCYFYNPVYQTADGEIYLLEGTGSSANIMPGSQMTSWHTLKSSHTTSEGESYEAVVKIQVQSMCLPEQYVLIAMDENHQELSRAAYTPEELPEEIAVTPGAAYLLVESHNLNENGETEVTRTIYSPDDAFQTLDVFVSRADFVCIKSCTKINWE